MRRSLVTRHHLGGGHGPRGGGEHFLRAQQESVKRTVLLRQDLDGMPGKEGVMFLVELAPGAVDKRHVHPGYEFAYILEGKGVMELEGKPPVTLTPPGMTIYQPPNQALRVRNASRTAPAKAVVFLVLEKDQPIAVPKE